MSLLDWVRRIRRRPWKSPLGAEGDSPGIRFEGGNGETVEAAIVVRGARFDLEGTYAEFAWLEQMYGQKDKDWDLLSHSHGKYGGRDIDTIDLRLADGTLHTVFFDCTESLGKWPVTHSESGGSIVG